MKVRLEQKLIGDRVVDGRFFINGEDKNICLKNIVNALLKERGYEYWLSNNDAGDLFLNCPTRVRIFIKKDYYNEDVGGVAEIDAEIKVKRLIENAKEIVEMVEKSTTRAFEWEI